MIAPEAVTRGIVEQVSGATDAGGADNDGLASEARHSPEVPTNATNPSIRRG